MENHAAESDSNPLEAVSAEVSAEALVEESEPEFEVATPEQLEQADKLIAQSNLAKIRGDKSLAERLLEEASKTAPGSSRVQEALGDAYLERKQVRKARDCFKIAFTIDPKNVSAERKYGEAVLAIQLAFDPNFATPSSDSLASGNGALILSFLFPGLGQLAASETKKGMFMMTMWVLGWGTSLLIPKGWTGMGTLFGHGHVPFNGLIMVPLFFCAIAWMWSISDASAKAKKFEVRKIEHPLPPVDKEY